MIRSLISPLLLLPLLCTASMAQSPDQASGTAKASAPVALADLVKVEKQILDMYPGALACTVAVGRKGRPAGASGVIVSEDGLVMTCAHVIKSTGDDVEIYLSDGRKLRGRALGSHASVDAAMIQILDKGKYPYAEVRRSSELVRNEWCVMMGHPQMLQKGRTAPLRLGRFLDRNKRRRGFVRTSCTMMGGDSGGPLFDLEGRVVGINSNINVGLTQNNHVSTDVFVDAWDRMRKGERWGQNRHAHSQDRVILGMNVQKTDEGRLRIARVQRYASAEAAGIKVDDVLVAMAGKPVDDPHDIGDWLKGKKAGDKLPLKLLRGDEEFEVQVRLRSARQVSAAMLRARARARGSRGPRGSRRGSRGRSSRSGNASRSRWVGTGAGNPFRRKGKQPFDGPYLGEVRAALDEVVAKASRSVVPVYVGKVRVAMATAVRKHGYLLTKLSEIEGQKVIVRIDAKDHPVRILHRFPAYDLAMIRVDADLPVLSLGSSPRSARVGALVTAAGPSGKAMEIGVVSVAARSLQARRPFLGVSFEARSNGLHVRSIEPGSNAAKMGLSAGDEVLFLNGKSYDKVTAFIADLKKLPVGTELKIGIDRDGAPHDLEGTLGSKFTDDRVGRLHLAGGQLSKHRAGFAQAIQTDLTLDPRQCGSPLLGLDGQVLGINIARSRRVASYAIPTSILRKLLKKRRIEKV